MRVLLTDDKFFDDIGEFGGLDIGFDGCIL